ncbi:MAG: rhombotarget lipoprotein [Psychromonas sp.]
MKNKTRFCSIVIFAFLLISCSSQESRSKSSVVDFLYPAELNTVIQPSIPTLNLPLKVGIAFVPEQSHATRGVNQWTGLSASGSGLTSASKTELLDRVASSFKELSFVSDIEVIPAEYLQPGGSFNNLEQIQTMYGIDIIALVSYDQVQFTDEGVLSLTYWTIVGAYVVSGEINDTSTMLDTVVYDIKSKKMLFRAPGTSVVKGSATPVNLSKQLREDSFKGFNMASEEMTKNLHMQLTRFKENIKKNPEQVKIVHRQGYSGGGGAFNLYQLILLLLIVFAKNIAGSVNRGKKQIL